MEHAPFGRRLIALVIDWLIASLSAVALAGASYPPDNVKQNLVITAFFVAEVALTTGLVGFSIGKRLVGLRVEGPDGQPIGVLRAVARTILICLVIPPLVTNPEGRGLHDVFTTSRVVKTPRA